MPIHLTPDIVFWLGFRPDLRRQLRPKNGAHHQDILLFRRADNERTDWKWAGDGTTEPVEALRRRLIAMAGRPIGESQLSVEEGEWADTSLSAGERRGSLLYRAWRRFRIGATWLDSADFILMDRLHGEQMLQRPRHVVERELTPAISSTPGHIVSLVLGIPHILIHNKIGKLGDYHPTWTK